VRGGGPKRKKRARKKTEAAKKLGKEKGIRLSGSYKKVGSYRLFRAVLSNILRRLPRKIEKDSKGGN